MVQKFERCKNLRDVQEFENVVEKGCPPPTPPLFPTHPLVKISSGGANVFQASPPQQQIYIYIYNVPSDSIQTAIRQQAANIRK